MLPPSKVPVDTAKSLKTSLRRAFSGTRQQAPRHAHKARAGALPDAVRWGKGDSAPTETVLDDEVRALHNWFDGSVIAVIPQRQKAKLWLANFSQSIVVARDRTGIWSLVDCNKTTVQIVWAEFKNEIEDN